jgi:hypothetical protein
MQHVLSLLRRVLPSLGSSTSRLGPKPAQLFGTDLERVSGGLPNNTYPKASLTSAAKSPLP